MSVTPIKKEKPADKEKHLVPQKNSKFELVKTFNKKDILTKSGGFGSPSVIEWDNQLLMLYQEPIIGRFFCPPNRGTVYLCNLDNNFNIKQINELNFDIDYEKYLIGDVRFFIYKNELWYSGVLVDAVNVEGYQRLFISKYNKNLQPQSIKILEYDKGNPKREKNWAFFEYLGKLMATYSIWQYKHNIVTIDINTGKVVHTYQHDFSLQNCSKQKYELFKDLRPTAHYIRLNNKLYGTYHTKYEDLYKNICGIYSFDLDELSLNIDSNDYLIDNKPKIFSILFPIGLFYYNNILYLSIGTFKSNQNKKNFPYDISLEIWRYDV